EPLPKNERMVYDHEQGDYQATPVYGRERLEPHMTIQGPAIIEECESTMVMPKGYSLQVDPYYNLIIQKEAKKEGDVTNGSRYRKESRVGTCIDRSNMESINHNFGGTGKNVNSNFFF